MQPSTSADRVLDLDLFQIAATLESTIALKYEQEYQLCNGRETLIWLYIFKRVILFKFSMGIQVEQIYLVSSWVSSGIV